MFAFGIYTILHMLFLITKSLTIQPPNLNLLKNNKSTYCVISNEVESTALTLLKNGRPIEGTQHYLAPRNLINKIFQCNISIDSKCKDMISHTNTWKYDYSDNYNLPPILDRRWEGLSTMKTGEIKFVNALNFTGNEKVFTIVLSIKAITNAYIYLCDSMVPSNSQCYWFIIGGWEGKHSIVRKCDKGAIPNVVGVYPSKSCGIHPDDEKEPKKRNHTKPPINLTDWSTFTLTKNGTTYSLKQKGFSEDIISYIDSTTLPIVVRHLLVTSVDSPGEWEVNGIRLSTGGLLKIKSWSNTEVTRSIFSVIHPTNEPAFIFLCDKEFGYGSRCQRIKLENGKKMENCLLKLNLNACEKNPNTGSLSTILSPWQHFILKKNGNNYRIFSDKDVKYIEFSRADITHLYLGSVNMTYWKSHSYGIFVSNTSGNTTINLSNGKKGQRICIAVFTNVCRNCTITLDLENGQKGILATIQSTKIEAWEELKLEAILKADTTIKLNIRLNVNGYGFGFIGDMRDCSKNVRVVKTHSDTNDKSGEISCTALKFPNIRAHINNEAILAGSATNSSIIDTVWITNKDTCRESDISTDRFEHVLSCKINDTNITNTARGEDFCYLAFEKNNTMNTCSIYDELLFAMKPDDDNSYSIWIFIVIATLCCCIAVAVYIFKKNRTTLNTGWIYIIPRTYQFITSELLLVNRVRENAPLLQDGYSSVNYSNFSNAVKVEAFIAYVNESLRKGELLSQFNMVNSLEPQVHSVGLMEDHVRKNRYKDIIAYDATRVKLDSVYSNVNDDYINANYIKGYKKEEAFIATQGPTYTTILDFWRMIWQKNIQCIVMLSKTVEKGRSKCLTYWPEPNETKEFCEFKITCTGSSPIQDVITLRTLKILFDSEEREINQIHYEGWVDQGVPNSSKSLKEVLNIMKNFKCDGKPIVVHCSAGVGRTGTLILCDISIEMAKVTKTVDILSIFYELRQQRGKMVQTFDQYVYAHEVIADALEDLQNAI